MMQDHPEMKKQEQAQIVELGTDLTKSKKGNIYTLTIIGQVEGHQVAPETVKTTKYEHVLPLLAGIEESDDVDGLLLLLNTVGGDIEAGLAIAEMIAGMKKPTVSLVLGGGHSIGIPLAVCTKKSFITPTASMTVHPVRMTGLVIGAPQTFRYFQRIQEQIADFVTTNSGISRKKFEQYMMATGEMAADVGTILYGKEAVSSGLIDCLGGLNDALTELHHMIESNRG
jgi:ATP-dependent protease ClpP protease subunit